MKILHTGDWHIGSPRSPYKEGVNLRSEDTKRCLDEMVRVATGEHPDYSLVSGDIFDAGKVWSDRCCSEIVTACYYIQALANVSGHVIVMRGTENHDGESQFTVLEEMFENTNVIIATKPGVLKFSDLNIAVLPGFSPGAFAAEHPDLGKEERNAVVTDMLSDLVLGLKAQCAEDKPSVLMAHYTVPGANIDAGQTSMLAQFEPMLDPGRLASADFDLVALGHIHRPQFIDGIRNCCYCGAINTGNFNDEGQERGFWLHSVTQFGLSSDFHVTPYRQLKTLEMAPEDVGAVNIGNMDSVREKLWPGDTVKGKIVRVRYSCDEAQNKAFNRAALSQQLLSDGAFMVWEILPTQISEFANRTELGSATDPVANLVQYLKEKEVADEEIEVLVKKARPIIEQAQATVTKAAYTGTFEPVEIYVKNYRNYVEETFDFSDISFCTINGQNGAGKSSLFMDAILDCLYEEPREGEKTGWIRNDESAHSAAIRFTFRIGDKTFRVARTRARSGKGTLNLAELVNGEWEDRSCPKYVDTQKKIQDVIGMDSTTFRSCALIMQDQYGIFLQAMPEERVRVLSTLLGLDIYKLMERTAADTARECGGEKNKYKSMIEVARGRLESMSEDDPEEKLEEYGRKLEEYEGQLADYQGRRDEALKSIAALESIREKARDLELANSALATKKDELIRADARQMEIITENRKILESEAIIREGAERYRTLKAQEEELSAQDALYNAKLDEGYKAQLRVKSSQDVLNGHKANLAQLQGQLDLLREPVNEAFIRERADRYSKLSQAVADMKAKQSEFLTKKSEVENWNYRMDAEISRYEAENGQLVKKLESLRHRAELLNNSGCVDPGAAKCRFLLDAREAEMQIPDAEKEIEEAKEKHEAELSTLNMGYLSALGKVQAVQFDSLVLTAGQAELESLASAPDDLKKMEERQGRITAIEERLADTRVLIGQEEERLSQLTSEATAANEEIERLRASHDKLANVRLELSDFLDYPKKEMELPLASERLEMAERRRMEIGDECESIRREEAANRAEIEKARGMLVGLDSDKEQLSYIDSHIKSINTSIAEARSAIGAAESRIEQIDAVKKEIAGYREKKNEASKKTAYYDTLKTAFSQGGIPHQIIRSIIPQLTSTANTIIGQMTGGKMGVEFRLERYTKNLKERASLDIYIEEGANAPLPYLSKSGGEKVKASLSVILALAEIKSSSVGVQLGMLFIDEPPFLDGDGIQAYCDALETIQNRYPELKIMAITHDPTMKARFPQSLDVVKTDEGSKVVY